MNRAEKRRQRKLAGKSRQQNPATQQAIGLAVQHQSAGRLPEAEGIYRQILQSEPNHPDALHLLGMIANQVGNYAAAVELINKSLASRPDIPEVLSNLGNALKNMGRLDEAVASYQKAIAIKPDFALAHINLGMALKELGKLDQAVDSYNKVLAIKPDFIEAHYHLGNALKNQGKLEEAVARYLKVLDVRPDYAEAHNNLGNAMEGLGKLHEAVASYRKAIVIKPDFAEAHYNLGNAQKNLRETDEAVTSWQNALIINPGFAEAYCNLGAGLMEQGKLEEAVASCQKAIDNKPDYAKAYCNMGAAFSEMGNLTDAVASSHKALAIDPDHAEAWNNLTFASTVLQFSKPGGDLGLEPDVNGLSDAARATIGYTIYQFHLRMFRPHKADESYQKVIAALPAVSEQTIPINGAGGEAGRLPDKMVALLSFGRSGTGLMHSLIDGHPEISTLPGVYFRGYFNQGVWEKLSADGRPGLVQHFADQYAVLFDARVSNPIPSRLAEPSFSIGESEGMTSVGENRDEYLSVDREAFCVAASRLMEGMDSVDPMSFLMAVHAAFEEVTGSTEKPDTNKSLCFYHIHNPDTYAESNFLRHAPNVRLLVMVREPIQNCESSINSDFKDDAYSKVAHGILGRLFDIDQISFRMRRSLGVRLEDVKAQPEATMQALCDWMGVEDSPTLYEMTAQGKKWWGDPSSPDYANDKQMSPFDDAATKRSVGAIFSEKDQFILGTLFYPFSVRFGYRDADPDQFRKDLKQIRPMFDEMMDFEKTMAERLNIDDSQLKQKCQYRLLRAGMLERWNVLDELGDYPHMLEPLSIG